jgi:tRNA-2-methylthio-N6-dimethylallyladenosine synthase
MKFYIKTFGCQANFRDSEWIAGRLLASGWQISENPKSADLAIVNTCSVRRHAEERAFSLIGRLKKIKNQNAKFKIALTGCTAEAYGEKLLNQFPYLDALCGPSEEEEFINRINELFENNKKIIALGKQDSQKSFYSDADYRKKKFTAFVSIMEGCNNFCSYCIVPYVRGRERSRPIKEIVDEVKCLIDKGYKEVMLLGQNVNSYKIKNQKSKIKNSFIKLLEEVDKTGIERIRFMTSHPKDANIDLFKAMRDLNHVCEHIHLPVQSGSTKILKLMNRRYTRDDYLKLVDILRKILPECSITTDIIVGFPQESVKDFEETIDLMKKVEFDSAFIFKYSPRPFAPSSKLDDDVPQKEKEKRNQIALEIQKEISLHRKMNWIGQKLEVLFEGKNKQGLYMGRSRQNFTVYTQDSVIAGKIKDVYIKEIKMSRLIGEVEDE